MSSLVISKVEPAETRYAAANRASAASVMLSIFRYPSTASPSVPRSSVPESSDPASHMEVWQALRDDCREPNIGAGADLAETVILHSRGREATPDDAPHVSESRIDVGPLFEPWPIERRHGLLSIEGQPCALLDESEQAS
jgi:hypothetical protein